MCTPIHSFNFPSTFFPFAVGVSIATNVHTICYIGIWMSRYMFHKNQFRLLRSLSPPILFDYYLRLFSIPVSILSFAHVLLQKQLNLTLSYYNFWLITSFNHSVSFHSHDFLNLFSLSLSFSLWAVVLCTLCNVWHNLHVLQSHGNANCRNGNYCMNFSSKIYDGAPFDQWQI